MAKIWLKFGPNVRKLIFLASKLASIPELSGSICIKWKNKALQKDEIDIFINFASNLHFFNFFVLLQNSISECVSQGKIVRQRNVDRALLHLICSACINPIRTGEGGGAGIHKKICRGPINEISWLFLTFACGYPYDFFFKNFCLQPVTALLWNPVQNKSIFIFFAWIKKFFLQTLV